ncbi:hypothetical protein EDD85DRAFT_623142 [Armillaria nabsnona]|nr:hypothetical protein EDD85DRAFT_623142 [Armillaria nabsnona]
MASLKLSNEYDIYVAQFGHPLLRGAKHWSIVVMTDPKKMTGIAYQISGGTETYEVKPPEGVDLLDTPTYMGRVKVGKVTSNMVHGDNGVVSLGFILTRTPVVLGNVHWNCQNWVAEGLKRLKDAHHSIDDDSLESLQRRLSSVGRESRD